eukprot:2103550-Rhodomonas_salina.1
MSGGGFGVKVDSEEGTNPFGQCELDWQVLNHSDGFDSSMLGLVHSIMGSASNVMQSDVSADTGKKRRKSVRKADDPMYNKRRQQEYRNRRNESLSNANHPDADLWKYLNLENEDRFLDAGVVVVASPDHTKTAFLGRDCSNSTSPLVSLCP